MHERCQGGSESSGSTCAVAWVQEESGSEKTQKARATLKAEATLTGKVKLRAEEAQKMDMEPMVLTKLAVEGCRISGVQKALGQKSQVSLNEACFHRVEGRLN